MRSLCAIALVFGAVGCAPAAPVSRPVDASKPGQAVSEAPKQATVVPVGQSVEVTEQHFGQRSVTVYTVSNPAQHKQGREEFVKPQKGVYLVLTVTAAVKEGSASVNALYFKLVAADGTVHEGACCPDFQPQLNHADVTAGQKASGLIVFDVPPAAIKGAKIELKTVLGDAARGAWTLG